MSSSVNDLSCESCNLNKAASAPQNRKASHKPAAPLQHLSCDLWSHVIVPSPYGMKYGLLVIDHHTNFMWVRFLKSKDETCAKLETILLDVRHTHARFHSHQHAFAPFLKVRLGLGVRGSQHAAQHAWGSSLSSPHRTHITCWGRPNVRGALCVTARPQCSTRCLCLIACGHARSSQSSTSITAPTVALSVHLEGFPSPFLRAPFRMRLSFECLGVQCLLRCPIASDGSSA
jgi:hypothetical protein